MPRKQYYIHPGRLLKIDQPTFQARLIAALGEVSAVTNTTFHRQTRPRGIQFRTITTAQMLGLWSKYGSGVPLALQIKNNIYFLNDADRFRGTRAVEAVTIHELGHVFRIAHSTDPTSIMNGNFTSRTMNAADVKNFQRRLGKPRAARKKK